MNQLYDNLIDISARTLERCVRKLVEEEGVHVTSDVFIVRLLCNIADWVNELANGTKVDMQVVASSRLDIGVPHHLLDDLTHVFSMCAHCANVIDFTQTADVYDAAVHVLVRLRHDLLPFAPCQEPCRRKLSDGQLIAVCIERRS